MEYTRILAVLVVLMVAATSTLAIGPAKAASIPSQSIVCSSVYGNMAVLLLRDSSGYINKLALVNLSTGSITLLSGFSKTTDYNLLAARIVDDSLQIVVHSLHDNKIYIYTIDNTSMISNNGGAINVSQADILNKKAEIYIPQGTIESAAASLDAYKAIIYSIVLVPKEKGGMNQIPVIASVEFAGRPLITSQASLNLPGEEFIPLSGSCNSFIAGLSQTTLTIGVYLPGSGLMSVYATLPSLPDLTSIVLLPSRLYTVLVYTSENKTNVMNIIWFNIGNNEIEGASLQMPQGILSIKPERIIDLGRGNVLIQAFAIKGVSDLYRVFVLVDHTMRRATIYMDKLNSGPDYVLAQKGFLKLDNSRGTLVSIPKALKELSKQVAPVNMTIKWSPIVGAVTTPTTKTVNIYKLKSTETTITKPAKTTTASKSKQQSQEESTTSNKVEKKKKLLLFIGIIAIAAAITGLVIYLWRTGRLTRRTRKTGEPTGTVLDVGI